jgi:putative DNA primase/helicase
LRERAYWVSEWTQWVHWSDGERRWVRADPLWIEREGPNLLRADFDRQLEDLAEVKDADRRRRLEDEVRKAVKQLEKARLREIVIKGARPHCVGRPDLFDSDPWILGLPGGYIWDLREGHRLLSDPLDHVSMCTNVLPADTLSPEWVAFVSALVLHTEERVFLQQSLGAALIGLVAQQRIFLWMGSGGNGKTALSTVLLAALGDYTTTNPADILAARRFPDPDDQHKAMARFVGRRLVFLGELSQGAALNESLVKWITGGEPLVARRLHQDPFEVPNTATFFMPTNHLPRVLSGSDAIWRRITPLEFRQEFEHNEAFMEKLRTDAELHSSALRWLLDGCQDYLEHGLDLPKAVTAFRDDYREEEDHFDTWYEERARKDPQARTRAKKVQEDYAAWCRERHITAMSAKELGGRLAKKGHYVNSARVEGFQKKQRCYWHLALRDNATGNG